MKEALKVVSGIWIFAGILLIPAYVSHLISDYLEVNELILQILYPLIVMSLLVLFGRYVYENDQKDKRQLFKYKGNYYRGVKNCLRKDIVKDVWIESIIYECEKDKKTYVRDFEDFNNKFKEVK